MKWKIKILLLYKTCVYIPNKKMFQTGA